MAGQLHFDRAAVEELIALDPDGSLTIVGDEGIYLMTRALDSTRKPKVVYAIECDPTKLKGTELDMAKRRIWGGDDGAERLPCKAITNALATYRPGEQLILDVNEQGIGIIEYRASPRRRRK